MTLAHGFVVEKPFQDRVNFPYGFSKSGDFSISESEILQTVGQRLVDLENGVASPDNQVEENFVAMCQGENEALTKVERTWAKYKKLIGPRRFHALNGGVIKSSENDYTSSSEDDC